MSTATRRTSSGRSRKRNEIDGGECRSRRGSSGSGRRKRLGTSRGLSGGQGAGIRAKEDGRLTAQESPARPRLPSVS